MTTQTDILSALETKKEAMQRSEDNADSQWKARCIQVIHNLALEKQEITADDVQDALKDYPESTRDLHAIGPMFRRAAKLGYIAPTDRHPPSRNPKNHGCPRRVWSSLLH